jgi:hypothetical protein
MKQEITEIPQIRLNVETYPTDLRVIKLNDQSKDTRMGKKPKIDKPEKINPKIKILGSILAILFVLTLVLLVGLIFPAVSIYKKGLILKADAKSVQESIKAQDLEKVKTEIAKVQVDLKDFSSSYDKISWIKSIPLVGPFWRDGKSIINAGFYGIDALGVIIETATPYADIIGFNAGARNAEAKGETTNDRVEFFIRTLKEITPKLQVISEKANLAKAEIDKIDANRYPVSIRGHKVRENIKLAKALIDEGVMFISQGKPLLEVAPKLLGIDSEKRYLILFQNDKELRPTGGFLTAYSIMTVRNGKFEPVSSNDIYNLDSRYTPSVKAPDAFIKYLKGPYLISGYYRLRDMNWSPDFKESMDLFVKEAETAGIGEIDGVIAVDTNVLVKLLDIVGPIGVPGFGNYSTQIDSRCNCPQVIYELESFADIEGPVVWSENEPGKIIFAPPNYDNRKKIVGPLMNSILANVMGQPKDKLPKLFQAAWESLTEKHILFYSLDENSQKAGEAFNITGRVQDYDGDYLQINDANLGGRKSNLYVTQEVSQDIQTDNNANITKTLTVTYKNTQSQDGWLNSVLPSWVRIYVPRGSQLLSFDGLDDKVDPYEDLGKTVFAGLYNLRPQGVVKLTVKYKLPFKAVDGEYKLLVQKQPGLDAPMYTIQVNRQKEEIQLKLDHEFHFKI